MSFVQHDNENTLLEIRRLFFGEVHRGALVIGLLTILILVARDRSKFPKRSLVSAPLIAVLLGVGISEFFRRLGGEWEIQSSQLVKVPIAAGVQDLAGFLIMPDWSQWNNPARYYAAITIALVASLETLINLEAVDRIDPLQRQSLPQP